MVLFIFMIIFYWGFYYSIINKLYHVLFRLNNLGNDENNRVGCNKNHNG